MEHIPVFASEALSYLDLSKGDSVIDATLGTGGHSRLMLEAIGPKGHLLGIDQDPFHLEKARNNLAGYGNAVLAHGNFRDIGEIAREHEFGASARPVQGILFDLGLHSLHVNDPSRGFSFRSDGPLDMRFDPTSQGRTAAMILNQDSYEKIVSYLSQYGQERYSKRIAKAIVDYRKNRPFRRTLELAELVEKSVPYPPRNKKSQTGAPKRHSATRVFQALRIAVNFELEALYQGLNAAVDLLEEGGRLVVISYHSLEDRIAKNVIRDRARSDNPTLKILTKKPVTPTAAEIENNPRSRSALLRAAEKI